MTSVRRHRRNRRVRTAPGWPRWPRRAGREVGGVPVELLGDYLTLLADAATSGRKPDPAELDAVGLLGRRAAELGVSAGSAVQLYLSAARRLWPSCRW